MALTRWDKFKLAFEIVEVRLRFVSLLVGSALVVGYWDTILNYYDKWTRPPASAATATAVVSDLEFYCPMHTNVVRAEPGNCPICGMNLSKRKKGVPEPPPEGVERRVQLSPYRVSLAGVQTSVVGYEVLFKDVRTVGMIDFDERRLARLSARIAGRADELFVNFTGVEVNTGDPIYKLYSPDLVSAQEEYLLAVKTLDARKAKEASDARAGVAAAAVGAAVEGAVEGAVANAQRLVDSSRERLLLWGITEAQLQELDRTRQTQTHLTIFSPLSGIVIEKEIRAGQYLMAGDSPYTIADYSVVWMKAKVYEAELGALSPGQPAEIRAEAYPDAVFLGAVAFISPILDAATRTVDIRVDIPNRNLRLKPGMFVTATFRIPLGRVDKAVEGPGTGGTAEPRPTRAAAAEVWTCPMHPEVVSDHAGDCPKCGMHLLKKEAASTTLATAAPASSRLVWFCPMHPGVYTDKPGACTTCGHAELGIRPAKPGKPALAGDTCPVHLGEKLQPDDLCPICHSPGCYMRIEKQLAVPDSAVIDTGLHKVVYVEHAPGTYDAVEVLLGPHVGSFYPVTQGLKEGDRVVTRGSFLIDAESRLNPAAGAGFFGASGRPEATNKMDTESR
ncbi:MAG: efflux RND transporter periplasmic adaptor subunit [Planctomycetes bacterium]|nr:efflux RND transporter periplasmic adaptor subunit [Planctomycetota bacterium]